MARLRHIGQACPKRDLIPSDCLLGSLSSQLLTYGEGIVDLGVYLLL